LLATGLGIVACLLTWVFLGIKYNIPVPSRGFLEVFAWAVLCLIFLAYTLLRFIFGRNRTDDLTSKVLEKLARIYQRVSGTE
jgi:NADH:ubiquinone oxidoreductase subunit H